MADQVIQNPIINSPYVVPQRHARFASDDLSQVVAGSKWEFKVEQVIEDMPEVIRDVKNQGLNLTIPDVIKGEQRNYVPAFIAVIDDGIDPDNSLKLVVEVGGASERERAQRFRRLKRYRCRA